MTPDRWLKLVLALLFVAALLAMAWPVLIIAGYAVMHVLAGAGRRGRR